ncbi:type 1 glutamine amidotransferase domain-containing protein [Coralloluteibacterium thermophilus]|uniref:Type 1 glutamine amidotransferase domain-containing protein n=1 Tax=Coralloluteibacterium thermophilum TaxID=2707049 RepID=A0ABV9NKX4_9GAMM
MSAVQGRKVAMLATHGFEQSELTGPKEGLEKAGATVHVVSPESGEIKGWKGSDWGDPVKVDVALDAARVEDYDALVLPGGQINPDKLRLEEKAIALIKAFGEAGKPIAAICHGPWTLIDAGLVKGKNVTSWPSIRNDLINAGAQWSDKEVEIDGNIITSRKPDDVPAFTRAVIDALG